MTTSLRNRVRAAREGDAGLGMITVVIAMSLFMLLSAAVLAQVVSAQTLARSDQDWNNAFAAAQAGVDDYVRRLNEDPEYAEYNSATNPDPANPAMGTSGGSAKWTTVKQATGLAGDGKFHYRIDTTSFEGGLDASGKLIPATGTIKVTAVGWSGKRKRTLTSDVRRGGFLDNLYYTTYETKDPEAYNPSIDVDNNGNGLTDTWAIANCANKYYGARSSKCKSIQFANDRLSGPVHSNDAILICNNVTFTAAVTTAWSTVNGSFGHRRTDVCGSTSGTTFKNTGDPRLVSPLNLPETNNALQAETLPTATPFRGCLFTGETKIIVSGNRLKITSPWTKDTPVCKKDTWIPIPNAGVIYVDNAVKGVAGDVNSWPVDKSGKANNGLCTTGAGANSVGFPVSGEAGWTYTCGRGDVFIQQENGDVANGLDGRLTVAAKGDLYITGNLQYKSGTDAKVTGSMLGLIADNNVYYWHPVDSNNRNLAVSGTSFSNRNIDAALLSVQHSITVQNYHLGSSLSELNVKGNMTQKYRGIVKSGSSGYDKNYEFDWRLQLAAPPKFLQPSTKAMFGAKRIAEVPTPAGL